VRLALIPPLAHLDKLDETDYQLMLPDLASRPKTGLEYMEAYLWAKKRGDYVILDNGAAEGKVYPIRILMDVAAAVEVDEIVVPDVMKNKNGTIAAAEKFFNQKPSLDFKYMFVAQGTSFSEVAESVVAASKIQAITTIGLPRHLLDTLGHLDARRIVAMWINMMFGPRFEIHCLGANSKAKQEALLLSDMPFIRGMDTSMPFVYAQAGLYLKHSSQVENRKHGYFDRECNPAYMDYNIVTMKDWCRIGWPTHSDCKWVKP
jgi:hypothetical protein